jgi:bacterioferritin-associated ferredoxin
MYVCICKAVSDQDIRRAMAGGACTFESVQARTGCSTCCGCCEHEVRELLADELEREQLAAALPVAA